MTRSRECGSGGDEASERVEEDASGDEDGEEEDDEEESVESLGHSRPLFSIVDRLRLIPPAFSCRVVLYSSVVVAHQGALEFHLSFERL